MRLDIGEPGRSGGCGVERGTFFEEETNLIIASQEIVVANVFGGVEAVFAASREFCHWVALQRKLWRLVNATLATRSLD